MNNELDWCQMCGHYQPPYKNNVSNFRECLFCGAVIVQNQKPEDAPSYPTAYAYETVCNLLHKRETELAQTKAMVERLIMAGDYLALHYEVARMSLNYDLPSIRIKNWRKLATECKEQQ